MPTPPPHRLAWLPNAISVLRVGLVPAWLLAAEATLGPGDQASPTRDWVPLTIWAVIGASDVLDGFLARRWHVESRAGATIDAVADKAAQIAAFTWLALRADPGGPMTVVPLWFLALLIARDGVLLAGSLLVRARVGQVEIVHRGHGKAVSLLMFAAVLIATTARLPAADPWLFGPLAAFVLYSTARYVGDGLRQVRGSR